MGLRGKHRFRRAVPLPQWRSPRQRGGRKSSCHILPNGGDHGTRDIAFSLDNTKMFISVGSASNDVYELTFNAASPRQWIAFLRQQVNK